MKTAVYFYKHYLYKHRLRVDKHGLRAPAVFFRGDYANPHFLIEIHRLRAVAILFIVAIHCTYFLDWSGHAELQGFLKDFFDNSTFLFVFIAGFLFQHLGDRFSYRRYLRNKVRNVGIPYLIAIAPAIFSALQNAAIVRQYPELQNHSAAYIAMWLLVYGGATINYALWFMPVIFIYYAAAPLFRLIQNRPRVYALLLFLIPLSLFMHRPTYTHGHNFVLALYFLPAYLLGMWCSQYRGFVERKLDRYLIVLISLYILVLFSHFLLSEHHGKYTFEILFSERQSLFDWIFLQQALMTFSFYGAARKLRKYRLAWLDFLGEVSFTIYFVHLYSLAVLEHFLRVYRLAGTPWNLGVLLSLTVMLSSCVAIGVRWGFGRNSRMVLGS